MVNHLKSCCCGCDDIAPAAFIYIGPDTSSMCGKLEHEEPRLYADNYPFLFRNGLCDSWFYDECSPFCMQNEDVIHPVVDPDDYEIECDPNEPNANDYCYETELLDEDGNPVYDENGEPVIVKRVRVGLEVRVRPGAFQGQENPSSTWWPFGDRDSMDGGFNFPLQGGDIRLTSGSTDYLNDDKGCLPYQVGEGSGIWASELYQGSENLSYGDPNIYTGESWSTFNWPGVCMSWGQTHVEGPGNDTSRTSEIFGNLGRDMCGDNKYDLPIEFISYDRYWETGPPSDPNDVDPLHEYLDTGAEQAAIALYDEIKTRFGPQILKDGTLNPLPSQIYFGVDNSGSMGWCTTPGDARWDCPDGCFEGCAEGQPGCGVGWPLCCPIPDNHQTDKFAPLNPGAWQIASILYDIMADDIGEEAASFKFNPTRYKFDHDKGEFIDEPNVYDGSPINVDGNSSYLYTGATAGINYCAGHSCDESCFLWEYPANPDYWWFADLIPPVVQHKIYYDINHPDEAGEGSSFCTKDGRLRRSLYYCDCYGVAENPLLAPYAAIQKTLTIKAWELPVFFYDERPIRFSGELSDTGQTFTKTGEDWLGGLNDLMAKHFKCCNCSKDKVEACAWPANWPIPGWHECNGQNPAGGWGSTPRRDLEGFTAGCGWGGSAWPEEFHMDSPLKFRQDLKKGYNERNPNGTCATEDCRIATVFNDCYDGAAPCTVRFMAPFNILSPFEIDPTDGSSLPGDCPVANIHQKGVPCKCPTEEPPRLSIEEWTPTCDPAMMFPCTDAEINGLPPDDPDYDPEYEPPARCLPENYVGSPSHPIDRRDEDPDDSEYPVQIVCVKNCDDCPDDDPCIKCWTTTPEDCDYNNGQIKIPGACCKYGECIETAIDCCQESEGAEWFGEGTSCQDPEYSQCEWEDTCDPDLCYYWWSMTYDPLLAQPGETCVPEDPCGSYNAGPIDMDNWGSNVYYECCNINGRYECQNTLDCPGENVEVPGSGACCNSRFSDGCAPRTREQCDDSGGRFVGVDTRCHTLVGGEWPNYSWTHACPDDWEYGACCKNPGTVEGQCVLAYSEYCDGEFRGGSCIGTDCSCSCESEVGCVPFWEAGADPQSTPGFCGFPSCCMLRGEPCYNEEGGQIRCPYCESDCPCIPDGAVPCPENANSCCLVSAWTCPGNGDFLGGGVLCQDSPQSGCGPGSCVSA